MFQFRLLLCLIALICTPSFASASDTSCPASRSCCSYGSCELLYWTYQHSGYDFALKTAEWKRSPLAFFKGHPEGTRYSATSPFCPGIRIKDVATLFRLPIFFEVQLTYVPFKDHTTVKSPSKESPLASLTHPTTFAGGFPAERISSTRSLRYFLCDYLARLDGFHLGGLQLGVYGGGRALVLMQKWTLNHIHTHQKGPSRVEWNMKMGSIGPTAGFIVGCPCSDQLFLNLRAGGSMLKGLRGGSHLSWNFKTDLAADDHVAQHTPCNRWTAGWDAAIQAEYACFACFPCVRLTFGYDVQQWFHIPQRDHYDFVSWHCHKKRSTLTVHGATLGLNCCF